MLDNDKTVYLLFIDLVQDRQKLRLHKNSFRVYFEIETQ